MSETSKQNNSKNKDDNQGRRGTTIISAIIIAILAVALVIVSLKAFSQPPDAEVDEVPEQPVNGITVTKAPEGMTDDEIRAMLNEQARKSNMTIHIGKEFTLKGNQLYISFANDLENKYAQKITLEQDGEEIFASDAIDPGYELEYINLTDAQADKIHGGSAKVAVNAVNSDGDIYGNGAVTEVDITVE